MKPGRGRTARGQSDEFWTPRDIIAELERLNGAKYAVDFAATETNKVAPAWIGRGVDALAQNWALQIEGCGGPGWCNPPFSKPNLPAFTGKAWEADPLLVHPLDLLILVSPRADWWRGVWQGDVVGGHAIHRGPLRGQVLRFDCIGYRKEIIFLGYALRFLENGTPADGALGSHAVVRLHSKHVTGRVTT